MRASVLTIASPIGPLRLTAEGEALTGLYMEGHKPTAHAADTAPAPVLLEAARQLAAYFEGSLVSFDLALAPAGTLFQDKVWRALAAIPFGTTLSYGELARKLSSPRGMRAVGLANGRNPISIVLPCHRVIGADGSLTGYGGGLERKRWLLDHEARVLARRGEQLL